MFVSFLVALFKKKAVKSYDAYFSEMKDKSS